LIGVAKQGEYEGCIALILMAKRGDVWSASMWTFASRGSGRPVDSFRDAPIRDFKKVLHERNIWVLPQSKYSDAAARTEFGGFTVHRLMEY